MEEIKDKLDEVKKRAYARADIEFAKMQLRAIIAGFPATCDQMVKAITKGRVNESELRAFVSLISDLDRIETRIEGACKVLGINPVNNLEFGFLNTLREQRHFLQEVFADFNLLVKQGKIELGDG